MFKLGPFRNGAPASRYVLLIESLPYECLNNRLPADIEVLRGSIQFFEHARG
jgi:hypothetical protein